MAEVGGETVAARLEAGRKELLDLGLRNPLLNYRPLRSRGVEVVDELPAEVFRVLVRERRAMSFAPAVGEAQLPLTDEPAAIGESSTPSARHVDSRLQTALPAEQLQTRLLATYYAARTFVEEQGANILYLALGLLRWYEADASDEPRRAPLLLVPVELARSTARERFQLRYTEEESATTSRSPPSCKPTSGSPCPPCRRSMTSISTPTWRRWPKRSPISRAGRWSKALSRSASSRSANS